MSKVLIALIATLVVAAVVATTPAGAAGTRHCGRLTVDGARLPAVKVTHTSCRTGRRVVRALYRGKGRVIANRPGQLRVLRWRCQVAGGVVACRKGAARRIRARAR